MLTSRRSFSTQTLKFSQTSCLFFPFLSFSLVFLDGLTKIFVCFFLFLWKAVVTNNGLINMIFRVLWGHVLKTAINSSLSESTSSLAFQPLKTLYIHHHIVYGYQIWQGDLTWDTPTNKVICPFDHAILQSHVIN